MNFSLRLHDLPSFYKPLKIGVYNRRLLTPPSQGVSPIFPGLFNKERFVIRVGFMNTIQVNKKIHIFSLNKNPKSRHVEGCGAGTGAGRMSSSPSRVMAVDQAAELLGHGVDQLLLVPLVFPKLGKNIVFSARVSHPAQSRNRLWHRYRCSTLQPRPTKELHVKCPYSGSERERR